MEAINTAVYGIDFFGVGRFGRDPSVIRPDFSVEPFTTTPLDYSTLHLTWANPQSTDCTYLRLVRMFRNLSQYGGQPPGTTTDSDAQADGTVIFTTALPSTQAYTDTGLGSGFIYYTMWGWSESEQQWIRCSDVIGLVPIQWGYGWRMYNLLPMAYRDRDYIMVDPYNPWPVNNPLPPLQRFLQLIGFETDFLRTELESLTSINDPSSCSGALLPLMAQQLGLPHEPEIGMQQERELIANAVHLYKYKGSPRGLTEFCSIITGYPATTLVHHGYNCLLIHDDGVMADSIGTWQPWPPQGTNFPPIAGSNAGLTMTQVSNMGSTPLELYPGLVLGPPTYNNSGMALKATSGQSIAITTGGIPITDFMSQFYAGGNVTFRFQIYSTVVRQVEVSLWGDNGTGVPVQILPPTGAIPTHPEKANDWQMMTVTGTINPYPQSLPGAPVPSGPASYYWVYPRIRIIGVGTETHWITLVGLWPCTLDQIGVETPAYDYPRNVKVALQPQFSNLLTNTVTTFSRTNPAYPPTLPEQLSIGFDGLSAAANPLVPTGTPTGTMSIRPQTLEDAPGDIAVYGSAALQVDTTGPGATVWFGQIQQWSPTFTGPTTGWWIPVAPKPTADWFTGAIIGAANPRPWLDPDNGTVTNSWFMMPQPNPDYFGIGTDVVQGIWFSLPPQPPQRGNLLMFNVQNAQPFNFSVYARYLSETDLIDGVMDLGFRWIYADGSYVENTNTTYEVTLTDEYVRYSVAPVSPSNMAYLGDPPAQANPPTGQYPVGVFPFVRFPRAQQDSFLLNAAMLSPTVTMPAQYMDSTSMSAATGEFLQDPVSGASYYYQRRTPRIARLNAELYRWLPMGMTYTIQYMSGAIMPPLDPTMWPRLHVLMAPSTSLTATPT